MKLRKEFVVGRPCESVLATLCDSRTIEKLLPGTRVEERASGARELITSVGAFASDRELRFLLVELPGRGLRFEKICDGNLWRFFEGRIVAEAIDEQMCTVHITLEGETRAFVPELTVRAPLREHLEHQSKALRAELELAPERLHL